DRGRPPAAARGGVLPREDRPDRGRAAPARKLHRGRPGRQDPPVRLSVRDTPATALLLAAIGVVFVAQLPFLDPDQHLLRLGADQATAVLAEGQYWRLLTSMFLHGGWLHVLLNGWALYQIGSLFELWLGAGRLLGTYFATGLLASFTSVFWSWQQGHP